MVDATALDLSRRRAVGSADRGDGAHLDRRRGRAIALGAAAVAVSADLGAGVPVAPAAAPCLDADAAAAGDCRRHRAARLRWRAESAVDAGWSPALLLHHRHGLSWRARPHPAAGALSHG